MKDDRLKNSIESAAFMFWTKRTIGDPKDPYLERFIILQTPLLSLYVHRMLRSDYDKALHDHPWGFISLVLKPYVEEAWFKYGLSTVSWDRIDKIAWEYGGKLLTIRHRPFDILFRSATWRHRVIIEDRKHPAVTLVLTGPRTRKWGFWPGGKWCHWKAYNYDLGICESGPIAGRTGLD